MVILWLVAAITTVASVASYPRIPDTSSSGRAAKIVAQLSETEKYELLAGNGYYPLLPAPAPRKGYYVGNIKNNTRVQIPAIKLQDAAQGFRTIDKRQVGEVTAWPCSLAVAATWDEALVLKWGEALGAEHAGKGANVLLGPSVNVHRVARGGRNAEYISGEDPHLGSVFTRQYVVGVQSQNVMSVVKHIGFNNQETKRNSIDSHVDERAAFEVYYKPFQAAVDAGVSAAMCSYNLVNGTHACGNEALLNRDLKARMGFGGFVMSDWWAVHSFGQQEAGLDVDMPGNDGFFNHLALSRSSPGRVDDMATRVVAALISSGVYDAEIKSPSCVPPDCDKELYSAVATNDRHVTLARELAAQSTVLLKNEGGVLPLKPGSVVALVGSACDAPNDLKKLELWWNRSNYYTVGGSGRVLGKDPISILRGLKEAGGVEAGEAKGKGGGDGARWTLQVSATDDVEAAQKAMEGADVVMVCGATSSTESEDRASLSVDQEAFVGKVLGVVPAGVPSVVLLTAPGTVVTPWADKASAMAVMFLGGQETGRGWADVLSGGVNPVGRLPVTFPVAEDDMVAPCTSNPCVYSEGLLVGWRGLETKPVHFPFGHGLSYTSFEYQWDRIPTTAGCGADAVACMSVEVRNVGAVAGADVVQMYVGFPVEGSEVNKVLKGFVKTDITQPNASATVAFSLSRRDLSSWSVVSGGWEAVEGLFTVYIGKSSRDLQLSSQLLLLFTSS